MSHFASLRALYFLMMTRIASQVTTTYQLNRPNQTAEANIRKTKHGAGRWPPC